MDGSHWTPLEKGEEGKEKQALEEFVSILYRLLKLLNKYCLKLKYLIMLFKTEIALLHVFAERCKCAIYNFKLEQNA